MAWLEKLGAHVLQVSRTAASRRMHGGGTSRKRMHYAGDITGAEIMRTLRDEVTNHPDDIKILEFSPAVELILNEQRRLRRRGPLQPGDRGVLRRPGQGRRSWPRAGPGRLHIQDFMTTNHYGATGDGLVLGYRAGVPVRFLHTVQYHPTGRGLPRAGRGPAHHGEVPRRRGQRPQHRRRAVRLRARAARRRVRGLHPGVPGAGQGRADADREVRRLAGLADDRHPQGRGHGPQGVPGQVDPLPPLRDRHHQGADADLPDAALPERRPGDQPAHARPASPACSWPAR